MNRKDGEGELWHTILIWATIGAVTGAVSGTLSKLTDPNYTGTWEDVVVGTLTDGVIAAVVGKLPGLKNWTKGRNSYKAVYRSGLTKLSNNTASRMSGKVVYKGLKASLVGGVFLDLHFGFKKTKQIIDNRCLV